MGARGRGIKTRRPDVKKGPKDRERQALDRSDDPLDILTLVLLNQGVVLPRAVAKMIVERLRERGWVITRQ